MPEDPKPNDYRIEALDRRHDRKEFSCGVEPLDRYLKEQAGQDAHPSLDGDDVQVLILAGALDLIDGDERRGVLDRHAVIEVAVAVLEGAESIGIKLTHVYGLTEVYGPASVCAEQPGWDDLPADQRAQLKRRQGVPYPLQEAVTVNISSSSGSTASRRADP